MIQTLVPSTSTWPPDAAVMVNAASDPARAAGAFLPSRVSESIVNTAPELIVYVSAATRAAES